jgi:hypothetical protein
VVPETLAEVEREEHTKKRTRRWSWRRR